MSTAHKNTVIIKSSSIQAIKPTGEFTITHGQPYNPPIEVSQKDGEWDVTVDCGRKGSEDVALKFNTWSGSSISHEFGLNTTTDNTPDELNFAFGLSIVFAHNGQAASTTLYFGQGHVAAVDMNNWWIGSTAIRSSGHSAVLTVYTEEGATLARYTITGEVGLEAAYTFVITQNF